MAEEKIAEILHPNIPYIESDRIGKVICKGLAKLAKVRPEDPVDYLAKWLLTHQSQINVTRTVSAFHYFRCRIFNANLLKLSKDTKRSSLNSKKR